MAYIPPHLRSSSASIHAPKPSPVITAPIFKPSTAPPLPKKSWTPPTPSPSYTSSPSSASVLASNPSDIKRRREDSQAWKKPSEMEMLGNVSRSGGMGDEGDALKDFKVQERFRDHIEEKLQDFHLRFPDIKNNAILKEPVTPLEVMNSILLLLRKLREGIMASHRRDQFALEVYETSTLYSIQAANHPQLISSLSVLVPGVYQVVDEATPEQGNDSGIVEGLEGLKVNGSSSTTIPTMTPPSHFKTRTDRRGYFASLLLLYQICHLDSPVGFNGLYFKLTSPETKRGRTRSVSGSTSTSTQTQTQPHPFVTKQDKDIQLAFKAYKSITTLSPLSYSTLLKECKDPYQRIILSWGIERLRARSWAVTKVAYLPIGIGLHRACKVLLLDADVNLGGGKKERVREKDVLDGWGEEGGNFGIVRDWVGKEGGRVEGGKVVFQK